MLHISCNIGTRDLPDMYASALRLWAYISVSGKSLMPMLQLLHVGINAILSCERNDTLAYLYMYYDCHIMEHKCDLV